MSNETELDSTKVRMKASGELVIRVDGKEQVIAHYEKTTGTLEYTTKDNSVRYNSQVTARVGTVSNGTEPSGNVIRNIRIKGDEVAKPKTKRPKMGLAAARDADLPIVTSDNPRTEDPRAIIDMIVDGVREVRPDGFVVEVDRRRAIAAAVEAARPGDIVLIAGKGHEDYQIIGKEKQHFDDREEARAAVGKLAIRPANGQS